MRTSKNATTDMAMPSQKSVRRPAGLAAVPRAGGALVAMAQRASFERNGWTNTNTTLSRPSIASAQARRDAAAVPRFARRHLGVITSSLLQGPQRGKETGYALAVVEVFLPEASSQDPLLGEHPHQLEAERGGQDQGSHPADGGQEGRPAAHHLAQVERVPAQRIGAARHQPAGLRDDREGAAE